jgi:hypothetical protein
LSFFDEVDEPRPPRRARRAPSGGGRRRPPVDEQTLLVRRLVAVGAIVLVIVLLVVLVRGCVGSRREAALRDYNREVRNLVLESRRSVADRLFAALSGAAAEEPQQVNETINQLRVVAQEQLEQAEALDAPDAAREAQENLELVLSLREAGVAEIAKQIQPALGSSPQANAAVEAIAAQMQAFNASDVIYSQRVAPLLLAALRDNDIAASYDGSDGEQVEPYAPFLGGASFSLMAPANVARLLGTGSANADASGRPAPGLHGHQIDSVSVAGVTLDPSTPVTLPASPPPTFEIAFTNGGEHDEQNVRFVVEISSGTGRPLTASTVVPATTSGTSGTATVTFRQSPPTGGTSTIEVRIEPVPGETGLDNNSATFNALFE